MAAKEGVLALEQVYSVARGTDKKELAYAFVNHMLSPKVQKLMSQEVWYSPSNRKLAVREGDSPPSRTRGRPARGRREGRLSDGRC